MIDAHTSHPALLAVCIGVPGAAPGPADPEQWRLELEHTATTLRALLSMCAGCLDTRVDAQEVDAVFADADAACEAARRVLAIRANPVDQTLSTPVRLLLSANDAAAAAPQLSAAECGVMPCLPADRLFATQAVADALSNALRARFSRFERDALDRTVLGLPPPTLYSDEPTTVFVMPGTRPGAAAGGQALSLRWRERAVTLHPGGAPVSFGRGTDADVQIESALVSRHHASLDFRHTNFIFTDRSTNGSFVRIDQDDEVFLHHEQIVLRGNGVISLGRRIGSGGGKLIYFNVTS